MLFEEELQATFEPPHYSVCAGPRKEPFNLYFTYDYDFVKEQICI